MSRKITKRPQVLADLAEHAAYIGQNSIAAAERFLAAAESVMVQLADRPGLGSQFPVRNPRLAGLRVRRVRGFEKHLVFYLVRDGEVEIVRVLHGARDLEPILDTEL